MSFLVRFTSVTTITSVMASRHCFEAYKKAQEALKKLGDMTFSDAEIDAFLPKELKRSSPQQRIGGG
ncbi:MAG TPA: hypothetical protein VF665_19335 [Longimicrobium sp.]|uniref:hypothetical protein n=1 Tax=Longimicrobium sp. TaxID=2029185 RepID=UPI002ED9CFFA